MAQHTQNHLSIEEHFAQAFLCRDERKRKVRGGYIQIHLPKHPMAQQGWFLEHRAVVEQEIGRFLYPCEQVHHIDGVRDSNEYGNLLLYATQREHLLFEHANSRMNEPELVAEVLKAAPDPNVALTELSCSPLTARKILKAHEVAWVSAAEINGLYEYQVVDALKVMPKKDLAKHFGCCYQTLWRRFPHLLVHRPTAGFLDNHKADVLRRLLLDETFRQIGEHYKTSSGVVSQSLIRWSIAGVLPIAVAQNVEARPKCRLKLLHTPSPLD